MDISHSIKNISGEDIVYIYITVNDIYEFGKENLGKGENSNFLNKLRTYILKNIKSTKKAAAVLVINGVVIGTLTLASILPKSNVEETSNLKSNVDIYTEKKSAVNTEFADSKKEELKQDVKEETKKQVEDATKKTTTSSNEKNKNTKANTSSNNKQTSNSNKNTNTKTSVKKQTTTTSSKTTTATSKTNTTKITKKNTTNTSNTSNNSNSTTTNILNTSSNSNTSTNNTSTNTQSRTTIRFNNGGVISNIDIEEYVIGVVAAEMPASFSLEALKAQAVTARTYAMKKHSKGITLVNSTSHQVYYSEAQMKSLWGSSYNTYYNKIKNAVYSTKGQVLKYGGDYIEALFYAISNGKSELPKYVWNYSYPYLQAVSSSWDAGISAGKYSINMTYEKISEKLGVKVDKNSEIKILSRTAGDRVDKISISGKTFTGVEVRTKLGLRSADFYIKQNDTNVTISTTGFGHGVGMSQYGANGAAKAGLSYRQILSHYYPGTSLISI